MSAPFRSSRHQREILVSDWRDAEELAAWYMRETLELGSVRLTRNGADGGIDVVSAEAGAQVKHYAAPVGAPEVQQAKGASHDSTHVLFFSLSSYTKQAKDYAQASGVALFEYNLYGDVSPKNTHARNLLEAAPQYAAMRAEEEAAADALRSEEEAAAAAERSEQEARWAKAASAAAARRAKFQEAELQRSIASEREKILRRAGELQSAAVTSGKAIVAALESRAELVATVQREYMVGETTRSFILAEYASYIRPQERMDGSTPRESAGRIIKILGWARAGIWLDWKHMRARFLPAAVEAAARELLTLHSEVSDVAKLRVMSASEWAAVLCDWELREAQIEALIDEGCITDFEDVPDAEKLRLRVIAGLGKSREVLTPLPSRWRNTPRAKVWGEDAVRAVKESDFFGMGVSTAREYIDTYRRLYGIQVEAPGQTCYPLGSSPEDIERLRHALKQPSAQLPGMSNDPASVKAPLREVRSKAGLTR